MQYTDSDTLKKLALEHKEFAFDFEAVSATDKERDAIDPWRARPTLLAVSCKENVGVFPINDESVNLIRTLCTNPTLTAVAHNISYDALLMHTSGILPVSDFKAHMFDTLTLFWQVDEESEHGLKKLEKKWLGMDERSYAEIALNNPVILRIKEINAIIKKHEDALAKWALPLARRQRPYPKYSDPIQPWARIRRALIANKQFTEKDLKSAETKRWIAQQRLVLLGDEERAKYEEFVKAGIARADKSIKTLNEKAAKDLSEYAAQDVLSLDKLKDIGLSILDKEGHRYWNQIEQQIRKIAINMTARGMYVDLKELNRLKDIIEPLIEQFKAEIYDIAKQEFNIDSTKQLPRVLFWDLGIDPPAFRQIKDQRGQLVWAPKLNKKGTDWANANNAVITLENIPDEIRQEGLSAERKILESIAHPISEKLLSYRLVKKLHTTYVDKLLNMSQQAGAVVRKGRFRVNANFNPTGTKTGRFSSSNPNLQNIPSRGRGSGYDKRVVSLGPEIRKAFVVPPPDEFAPEGYALIICDQSQIELRLIAHFSGDPSLIEVYSEKTEAQLNGISFYVGDVHRTTSVSLTIPRKAAKGVNFGFCYGMQAEKFARENTIVNDSGEYDISKAKKWREGFFKKYVGISNLTEQLGQMNIDGRFSYRMLSKRFRNFPKAPPRFDRKTRKPKPAVAPGKILNAIIQGSSADLLKVVMIIVDKYVLPRFPGAYCCLQVHDELGYVVPKRYAQELAILIKYVMEYPYFKLAVPVLSSAKICASWADKDDDNVPEVGFYYAKLKDGREMVFDSNNWADFVELDKSGKVEVKSATGQLSREQQKWAATYVPDLGPLIDETGIEEPKVEITASASTEPQTEKDFLQDVFISE